MSYYFYNETINKENTYFFYEKINYIYELNYYNDEDIIDFFNKVIINNNWKNTDIISAVSNDSSVISCCDNKIIFNSYKAIQINVINFEPLKPK